MSSVVYERTAHVLNEDAEIDWQYLASRLRAPKGKVLVAMHPTPDKIGNILIPEGQRQVRADVGTIIAAPAQTLYLRGQEIPFPKPGEKVLVHPSDGTRVDFEGYSICSIGAFLGEEEWTPSWSDWFLSILARFEGDTLVPYGENLVIQLPEKNTSTGGILLPDIVQSWSADAEVVAVGALNSDVNPGMMVSVDMNLCTYAGLKFVLGAKYDRQFVIPPHAVSYIYA